MNEWAKMKEDNRKRREKLIRDNFNAPADTVLRAIMTHATEVEEPNEGEKFTDLESIMHYWYDVDEMKVRFNLNGMNACVWLIHQNTSDKPCVEDIADYTMNLTEPGNESVLAPLLDSEHYNGVYQ